MKVKSGVVSLHVVSNPSGIRGVSDQRQGLLLGTQPEIPYFVSRLYPPRLGGVH